MLKKTKLAVLILFALILLILPQYPVVAEDCLEYTGRICDDGNVLNGYWWADGWAPLYPSINSWFKPAPVWSYGSAVYYGPGGITANAEFRNLSLKGYVDGVSLLSPADIGESVWLKKPGGNWEGPFLVVDCAQHGDIVPIAMYRHEVVEVSWKQAQKWDMVSASGDKIMYKLDDVQVSKIDPIFLTGNPVYYPEWYLKDLQPATKWDLYTPYYESPNKWWIGGKWVTFNEGPISEQTRPQTIQLQREEMKGD